MTLKTVYVELVAKTQRLMQGFKRVDRQTSKLNAGFKRLGVALAAAFSTRAALNAFKGTVLNADKLIKTSRAVGVATDQYEKLSFVIEKRLGGSVGTTERLFKFLQVRLGDAGRAYDKYFRDAGLDPKELRKRSPADQALAVIAALSTIENATERTAVASRLLGEEVSLQVLKVAAAGSEAINDAADDYERIGSVFKDNDAAKTIENLTDESANLTRQMEVLRQQVAKDTAPAITSALEAIIDSGVFERLGKKFSELIENTAREIELITTFGSNFNSKTVKHTISKMVWDTPSPEPFDAKGSVIIHQNNKFTVVDRDSVRGIGKAVKKANDESMRAP